MNLYTITLTIFLVLNPLGNIPVFIATLSHVSPRRRFRIILREALFAFIILNLFLFAGQKILRGINVTESALGIAGGIVLFLIAIRLVFPDNHDREEKTRGEPFLVPLAIPLFAGPAAMTTVMLLADQRGNKIWFVFTALVIAWLISSLILLASSRISNLLGKQGLAALERLMGMILTTIAIQMLLTGIQGYFHLV